MLRHLRGGGICAAPGTSAEEEASGPVVEAARHGVDVATGAASLGWSVHGLGGQCGWVFWCCEALGIYIEWRARLRFVGGRLFGRFHLFQLDLSYFLTRKWADTRPGHLLETTTHEVLIGRIFALNNSIP